MLCFPPVEEVHLRRSPLREVVCQVRFPPLLRIVNEYPVDFQESIRGRFPDLGADRMVRVTADPMTDEPLSAKSEPPVFRFVDPASGMIASLSINFYALSTKSYTHWPDFVEFLLFLNQAARDVYELPYATRVGLRYINQITFENTGVDSIADLWAILRPELTALLRVDCWDAPEKMHTQLSLAGDEDEKLTLRCGFDDAGQPKMLLDFDYYSEGQIDLDTLPTICESYHDIIYRAFRWCIQDDKLALFDPVPASEED
jgi:uncharacterized protein (TIGR04255 family)